MIVIKSSKKNFLLKKLNDLKINFLVLEAYNLVVISEVNDFKILEGLKLEALIDEYTEYTTPYFLSSRKFKKENTIIKVGDLKIGHDFVVIAGLCSIKDIDELLENATEMKKQGVSIYRAGAYKPRTSPYQFQGLQKDGLKLLKKVKTETDLPVITEIVSENDLNNFEEIDILQVGARNMQNFALLKVLSKTSKPILLKRGFANTIDEFLAAADYLMLNGNQQIILCERGTRSLNKTEILLSDIVKLKALTHLPIIVDPTHGTNQASEVFPQIQKLKSYNYDGLMIEVNNNPEKALSDKERALTYKKFQEVMEYLNDFS